MSIFIEKRMRKAKALVIVLTIVLSTFWICAVKAEEVPIINVEMDRKEKVMVLPGGDATVSFELTVPTSLLAEIYRKTLLGETLVPPEVEIPMPENITFSPDVELEEGVKDFSLTGDANSDGIVDMKDLRAVAEAFLVELGSEGWNAELDINGDGIIDMKDIVMAARNFLKERQPPPVMVVPIREEFVGGWLLEQLALFGFNLEVVDCTIMPWGKNNETVIHVNAYAPQLAILDPASGIWRINVGPWDENATELAASYIFNKIGSIKTMLRSIPNEQIFICDWNLTIDLPVDAEILNPSELIGESWIVDFGEGTIMETHSEVGLRNVTVHETTVVTEQNITATESYLTEALSSYRVFKIDYLTVHYPIEIIGQVGKSEIEDWKFEKSWSCSWTQGPYSYTWSQGPLTATLKITPQLTLSGYIGIWGRWFTIDGFETWVSVTPSIKAEASVSATASYSKTWSKTFLNVKITTIYWHVACIPTWWDIRLKVDGKITVSASGTISCSASVTVSAWFKAGVKWTRTGGWTGIWNIGAGASKTGPTITGHAGATITPEASCQLSALLYGATGPYVEAVPYAPITITYNPNTWSIKLKFKVNAGVAVHLLCKDFNWGTTLWDGQLASWSGTW